MKAHENLVLKHQQKHYPPLFYLSYSYNLSLIPLSPTFLVIETFFTNFVKASFTDEILLTEV